MEHKEGIFQRITYFVIGTLLNAFLFIASLKLAFGTWIGPALATLTGLGVGIWIVNKYPKKTVFRAAGFGILASALFNVTVPLLLWSLLQLFFEQMAS